MNFPVIALFALLASSSSSSSAFIHQTHSGTRRATVLYSSSSSSTSKEEVDASLTPELKKMTDAFRGIGDDKLRYKQLLYMANQLPPLEHAEQTMIPRNKVPGCLSTVYVDGTATYDEEKKDYVIHYVGESDGLLTKGLVALLVRGLSGCTAEEIQKVNPEFIQEARISQSLTPGRNNGFLNMLRVMKQKAVELTEQAKASDTVEKESSKGESSHASNQESDRPIYNSMMQSLQQLKPITLKLTDTSYQHAGHAGAKGLDGESHFELEIVAEAFQGLNLVKRHQLIYMILGKEMPQIHALSIKANTPEEVAGES